jgi:hypothetical protein
MVVLLFSVVALGIERWARLALRVLKRSQTEAPHFFGFLVQGMTKPLANLWRSSKP